MKTISTTGKQHGFTFIELFLVVLIIGVFIGVSLPNLKKSYDSWQLTDFSRQTQSLFGYLRQRSIVEREIISLKIDSDKKEYRAQFQPEAAEEPRPVKTLRIPDSLKVTSSAEEILFYPNGEITTVTLTLSDINNQQASLTTEGVFGGIKLQKKE